MSIIDNVAELRARLEEIEREKSAAISGTDWSELAGLPSVVPTMTPEPIDPLTLGWAPPELEARGRFLSEIVIPPQAPVAWLSLQSKAEMLREQLRLYDRLRTECMQALNDVLARIATLKGKE